MQGQTGQFNSSQSSDSLLDARQLLASTASELSSPLVLLRQLSLALAADNLSHDERQQLIARLTLTSERALRTVRTLAFQPDAQPLVTLEPVNVMTLCNEVVYELTPLFTEHGRSITLQHRTNAPLAIADRTLLKRVLVGLGDNALHFGSLEQPVRLVVQVSGGQVRIGVRDYGPAVPGDVWRRLEGRVARQSVSPLPWRPQTSGVGLVAARYIAQAMGGLMDVTRHRDGATFYVAMRTSGQMSLL